MVRRFLMALAMAVTILVTGCRGDWGVPGGGTSYDVIVNGPNNRMASFKTNADTDVEEASYNPVTHAITIKGLKTNGSNLAPYQMQYSITALQEATKAYQSTLQLLGVMMESKLGGSIPGTGGIVGGTTQVSDSPEQAAVRKALLERVQACPFLAQTPVTQMQYYKYVQTAPTAALPDILKYVNAVSIIPVTP